MNHRDSLRSGTVGDLGRPCETDSAFSLPPPHTLLTFFKTSKTFGTPRVSGGQPHRPRTTTHSKYTCLLSNTSLSAPRPVPETSHQMSIHRPPPLTCALQTCFLCQKQNDSRHCQNQRGCPWPGLRPCQTHEPLWSTRPSRWVSRCMFSSACRDS